MSNSRVQYIRSPRGTSDPWSRCSNFAVDSWIARFSTSEPRSIPLPQTGSGILSTRSRSSMTPPVDWFIASWLECPAVLFPVGDVLFAELRKPGRERWNGRVNEKEARDCEPPVFEYGLLPLLSVPRDGRLGVLLYWKVFQPNSLRRSGHQHIMFATKTAVLASRIYQIWYTVVRGEAKLKYLFRMAAMIVNRPRLITQSRSIFRRCGSLALMMSGIGMANINASDEMLKTACVIE